VLHQPLRSAYLKLSRNKLSMVHNSKDGI